MAHSPSTSSLLTVRSFEVLRLALPANQRQSLPPAVQVLVEEAVELEGVLEVLHGDHDTGSRYLHFLEADGQRFALHFAAAPPTLPTGTRVRLTSAPTANGLYTLPVTAANDSSTDNQYMYMNLGGMDGPAGVLGSYGIGIAKFLNP